ncbi:hypothetical protein LTR34_003530 [Exophiala xenobiotica]|uniref:Peptidase M43 pregnancy-associated plasma-A domain-containing protein n=1 Tax=Vermiconidia calcicola TaxID=1690605 RepID=A0AAV9QJW6_9PEZI|nr:hypothetical protein LTR34_003530 [Exophiala xenobiotica]KAK5541514.1 hypothetical protein LTR23_005836 [Chaetothyriales sp. CCFEE 6169]KAK5542250.1 hypothetical protein LTR25_002135 [Vermiconidia calcicola]
MIRPKSLVFFLTCYLFVILSCTLLPSFALENAFPPGYPNIGGPPGYTAAQRAVFLKTFQDGIDLAKHTVLFWPCDPSNDEIYTRYFDPADAIFVNQMYRAIANIDFNLDLTDPKNVAELVSQPATWNEKFSRLSIHFMEDHPGLANLQFSHPSCNIPQTTAFVVPTEGGRSALMSVCPWSYLVYPFSQDIQNPPAWAVDPSKDQSKGPQYYDGYGCASLGISDSWLLYSLSAMMLHELMHFPGLFADVPGYDDYITIQYSKDVPHFIADFPGPAPPDGYGPYYASLINRLQPKDPDGVAWKGIWNADNFASYAASRYWSEVCGRTFKACPNQAAVDPFERHQPQWPF